MYYSKVQSQINKGKQLEKEMENLCGIESIINIIENQTKNPATFTHGTISICCEYDTYSDKPRHHETKITDLPWEDIKLILEKRRNEIVTKFEKIQKEVT